MEQDKLKPLREAMFHEEHGPINFIYADMEMFQDFKFGALLSTVTVAEEIKYIYDNLKEYNSRTDLEICKYFPALNKTEEEIEALLKDEKTAFKIAGISPFTQVYDNFVSLLLASVQHNKTVSSGRAPKVTLNIADIKYPNMILDVFMSNLEELVPSVSFKVWSYKRYDMPIKELVAHDIYFIYEMFNLVKEYSPSAVEFVQNGAFFGKKVFSPCYIDTELHKDPREYDKILVSTEYGLGLYCDFKYTPISLIMEDSNG